MSIKDLEEKQPEQQEPIPSLPKYRQKAKDAFEMTIRIYEFPALVQYHHHKALEKMLNEWAEFKETQDND